jgi:hypothetical protein
MVGLTGNAAARSGSAATAAVAATKDRLLMSLNFISKNHAAFHDEFHALHFGDVGQGVTRNGDQVGEFTRFHAAHLLA